MNIRATGLAVAALLALGVCHWMAQTSEEFKFWGTLAGFAALGLIAFLAGIAALIAPSVDRHPHIPPGDTAVQDDAEDVQETPEATLRTAHTGAES
ncbi:hypothetical protein ACQEVB_32760 [Pseudonocardia sp. CA-107938]|uniref:hypothetical protein n=1 Tax=Pseudonocardia sp. CA-107938 TaxID=3240021 RepID=UPI003D8E805E